MCLLCDIITKVSWFLKKQRNRKRERNNVYRKKQKLDYERRAGDGTEWARKRNSQLAGSQQVGFFSRALPPSLAPTRQEKSSGTARAAKCAAVTMAIAWHTASPGRRKCHGLKKTDRGEKSEMVSEGEKSRWGDQCIPPYRVGKAFTKNSCMLKLICHHLRQPTRSRSFYSLTHLVLKRIRWDEMQNFYRTLCVERPCSINSDKCEK